MESLNGSSSSVFVAENNIRYLQSKVQTEIESSGKAVSEVNYLQTFDLCDFVKERILNYEDEPQLSKAQNNLRRISIASELIVGICSIHDHFVDFAFTKILNDLLRLDTYTVISKKISHKTFLNLKRENYFAKEAHSKLIKSLNDEEEVTTRREQVHKDRTETEKESEIIHSEVNEIDNIRKDTSLNEIGQTLVRDSLLDDRRSNLIGDITEIRIEPPTETSNLNINTERISNDIILQPSEISITEPFVQKPIEEDIEQILRGNQFTDLDIRKSGLPENLLEPINNISGEESLQVEKLPSPTRSIENQIDVQENIEEWNFTTLEPIDVPKRKRLRLITDKLTQIPRYKMRAMQLNKNIEIQRVQVFEGPPRLLQSFSTENLMKTSSFNKIWSQNVKSSTLNKLYKRNLITENRPVEPFVMPTPQKRTTESRITESEPQIQEKKQTENSVLEEIRERVGMSLASGRSGVLVDVLSETRHPEISGKMLERESVTRLPMSKTVSPSIQPLDVEKINNAIPSPRIQQLQGTSLDLKKHSPPWFFSTEEKPPRAEFREFNFVKNKLRNYWQLCKSQGMEESISIREFLLLENHGTFGNYLTVLRIVDKLSIQRQLFVDYKSGDVLIKPFEEPYVSKNQLLVQGKEHIF